MSRSKGWLRRAEVVMTATALVLALIAYVISKLSGS
jgi:hypothetical protein